MTLPRGWTASTIEMLTELVSRGRTPSYVEASDLPVVNQRSIRWHGIEEHHLKFVDPTTWQRWSPSLFLRKGDILWNSTGTGTIGRAAMFRGLTKYKHVVLDSHVTLLRANHALDPQYLFALIRSPRVQDTIENMQSGSTNQVELSRGAILATEVPLPPLTEQRRIVAKLDLLISRIARTRVELARVSYLALQLREQTLSGAISGDLIKDFRADADDLWPEKTLEQIGTVITGNTPPTVEKDRLFGGPHAFFKPTDLDAGYHVLVPRETLTEEGLRRSRSVPAGSTLVTCIGATISKTGFARVACAFNQQINAIVPKVDTVPEWLFWAVSSPSFRSKIIDNSSATTMPIINKGRFQQLTLAVPPIAEQREIVIRIEAAFARADRFEAEAARASALLDRLEASILARAFRGELVPQDPLDEPASALLGRISAEHAVAPKARRGQRSASPAEAS